MFEMFGVRSCGIICSTAAAGYWRYVRRTVSPSPPGFWRTVRTPALWMSAALIVELLLSLSHWFLTPAHVREASPINPWLLFAGLVVGTLAFVIVAAVRAIRAKRYALAVIPFTTLFALYFPIALAIDAVASTVIIPTRIFACIVGIAVSVAVLLRVPVHAVDRAA